MESAVLKQVMVTTQTVKLALVTVVMKILVKLNKFKMIGEI